MEGKQKGAAVVKLAHGDGGRLTHDLIGSLFLKHLEGGAAADKGTDAALVSVASGRLAVTTDSFVVSPLFFPGGDLGKLAVTGTVNDLAVMGAVPRYLTAGFILEEGFPLADLEAIVASMAAEAAKAGVAIVTGDTKVVERGKGDGCFINTSGIGELPAHRFLGFEAIRPGDAVVMSGTAGDHGMAILLARQNIPVATPVPSDCAVVSHVIAAALERFGPAIRFMRDPTRGGLATVCKEIALGTGCDLRLREAAIPLSPVVRGAGEMLGIDPLYMACEGRFVTVCDPAMADDLVAFLRRFPESGQAARIGEVRAGAGEVALETIPGGRRLLDLLTGSMLPRIC